MDKGRGLIRGAADLVGECRDGVSGWAWLFCGVVGTRESRGRIRAARVAVLTDDRAAGAPMGYRVHHSRRQWWVCPQLSFSAHDGDRKTQRAGGEAALPLCQHPRVAWRGLPAVYKAACAAYVRCVCALYVLVQAHQSGEAAAAAGGAKTWAQAEHSSSRSARSCCPWPPCLPALLVLALVLCLLCLVTARPVFIAHAIAESTPPLRHAACLLPLHPLLCSPHVSFDLCPLNAASMFLRHLGFAPSLFFIPTLGAAVLSPTPP